MPAHRTLRIAAWCAVAATTVAAITTTTRPRGVLPETGSDTPRPALGLGLLLVGTGALLLLVRRRVEGRQLRE